MVDKDAQPTNATSATTPRPAAPPRRKQPGTAALAVLFSLLLIDAAVETFISGAPVRWWVAGTSPRISRFGPRALAWWALRASFWLVRGASVSFFVLLALLAATAWLPDGLTNGVAMLRQPTSIVLSAVSALAVACAGVVLVRGEVRALWGRAALGVLACTVWPRSSSAIHDGAAYPALLRGESFWQRLPSWLQGAFVGVVVAVLWRRRLGRRCAEATCGNAKGKRGGSSRLPRCR